ncbi:hypothetical protein [Halotia branconii]|uniref:SPOR domain-containing protein n=1 Tax=Halotia branconii CENA392 TaxID=1539056 RepID=A0AAJ6NPV6_9CYAN|nr:hypothetical protein [Halotia branconii]WGV24514.1 hypothetical protein QI031_22460 [Halotia branconii CENA392]
MSQNPPIDSGTQSSKTSGLKPALAAALASLEVQLDQELTRYRRTRIGTRTPNQSRVGNYIGSQPQELTDTTLTVSKTQPSVAEVKTNTPPTHVPDEAPPEKPAPVTIIKTEALDNSEASSNSESTEAEVPLPQVSSSSIVPATVKPPQDDHLTQVNGSAKQPDDYLESSEALLRSLTDEQPRTNKPNKSSDSLLSPLGIGSMLLLLVASLTLGYVVFNPKSLPQLKNIGKLFNGNSSPQVANAPEVDSNPQPQTQPEITSIPKYPNLAAKEFPEVKDPNDIVGLQPKDQLTPTAPPNPIVAQTPSNPLLVEPTPQVQQPLPPISSSPIPTAKSSPQPTTTPSPVSAEIKPAADGFYHLVIDNQGDRALAAARKVVPDAYLSPSKKFIYLASLKTKEQALQRLQQLQAKGIKARVQQP